MLHHSRLQSGSVNIVGIADTGAQSDLWSLEKFLDAGFWEQDLSLVFLSLCATNKSPIKISGSFYATLEGHSNNG